MAKMSRRELAELIESVEEEGGDATPLKALLAEVDSDMQKRGPGRILRNAAPHGNLQSTRDEEETMEERLVRRVGYLFPSSIPYDKIKDYDYRFTKNELIEQCRNMGLGVSGDKKELAAKIIAKGASGEVYIARETAAYMEEEGHPALPRGVTYPILYKEVLAVIDDVGHVTYTYFPSVGVGHVEVVNVKLPYRRRGFGRKLLQFAIDNMREKGISKVSASIWSKEGASLFKALDFSFVTSDFVVKSI